MPLQLVPGVEADADRAFAIERVAYGPSPGNAVFFPGPFPPGKSTRVATLAQQLREVEACRWVKVVDPQLAASDSDGNNAMIAFSMWFVWEKPWSPDAMPLPHQWGPGTNLEACDLFFGEMRRRWERRMAGKPHFYLKLLHTDPAHQRRGAGSMLVQWGATEADRLGLPSYLEASDEGRLLYEKFGYREIDRITADLSKWGGPAKVESVVMMRPAGGAADASIQTQSRS